MTSRSDNVILFFRSIISDIHDRRERSLREPFIHNAKAQFKHRQRDGEKKRSVGHVVIELLWVAIASLFDNLLEIVSFHWKLQRVLCVWLLYV